MLPFENRPWAKPLALLMIVVTVLGEIAVVLWLRHMRALDTAEMTALVLALLAVIPPNVHILRLKRGQSGAVATHHAVPVRR